MENQSQKTPVTNLGVSAPTQATKPQAGAQGIVAPQKQPGQPRVAGSAKQTDDVFIRKIVEKIKSSENILVALSRDPSVDEMAAAIGLTLFLDSIQKHTTAIYSGVTPDALQFLQPEGTFETNTDSLQDFIIALNKEKADHLRYKLDGDFVKVYITPYKTNITEEDLEFSHGDYNVNLVLALGVPSMADLDSALAEHGRIMHDATTVDITIDAPGKFAEIEWSDPGASSVSEMVTKLIFAIEGEDVVLDKETATALLTGIVAATGRFSNDRTNSDTMQLASKLMSMGADQQLISAHVVDNDSGLYSVGASAPRTDLAVTHDEPKADTGPAIAMEGVVVTPATGVTKEEVEPLSGANQAELVTAATEAVNEAVAMAAQPTQPAKSTQLIQPIQSAQQTQPVQPTMASVASAVNGQKDYAQMIAQALAEGEPTGQPRVNQNVASVVPTEPVGGPVPVAQPSGVTLPPPPAPVPTVDMMPPAMPNAQAVSNTQAGVKSAPANTPTAATQSGAFQIPGVSGTQSPVGAN